MPRQPLDYKLHALAARRKERPEQAKVGLLLRRTVWQVIQREAVIRGLSMTAVASVFLEDAVERYLASRGLDSAQLLSVLDGDPADTVNKLNALLN